MRGQIIIVWLEDNQSGRDHKSRVKTVQRIIENKGYSVSIEQVEDLAKAKDIISNREKRIDFFISDYNLGNNDTGLEYLMEIRKNQMYKQFFVLYSKNEYNEIRRGVIDKLQNHNIELFCNFMFISLAEVSTQMIEMEFEKAINISLSRWDELNAIRGLYMCEHAELEFLLRNKFSCFNDNESYSDLVNRLNRNTTRNFQNKNKKIFEDWKHLIKLRNLLAHTSEGYDNEKGYYIKSNLDQSIVIYEDTLDTDRLKLKQLKEKIIALIKDPNRSIL